MEADLTKPIALWATPRSISSAFDKMMRARCDHQVFTEPFSVPYYFGPERVSTRFAGHSQPRSSYRDVWDRLRQASATRPVFMKEMAHHLGPHLTDEAVNRFTSSFLVRDPAWSVPSFLAFWPDVTDEELGYAAQRRAFDAAWTDGTAPPVIDGDDLRADPEGVVSAWCAAVGIEHRADALRWEPGMPDDWSLWSDFFRRAAASTCFDPPDDRSRPDVDDAVAARIERCREHYDALRAHRIGR